MLKIKVNKKNCKRNYVDLVNPSIKSTGTTDVYDMVIVSQKHGLKENDSVEFSRKDGNIEYSETYDVKSTFSNSGFSITTEGKFRLDVVGYEPTWIGYSDKIYENKYFTEITLDNNEKVNIPGNKLNRSIIGQEYRTHIVSIKISSNIDTIADDTFIDCPILETIDVEENNRYFSSVDGALYNKNKTVLIYLPQNYQKPYYITPDTVKEIGDYAFYNCSELSLVSLHHNVVKIGKHSFENCNELKHIICRPNVPPQCDSDIFNTVNDNLKIYVPKNKEALYRKNWRKYRNNINNDVTVFYYTNDPYFVVTNSNVIDAGVDEDLLEIEFGTNVIEINESELPTVNRVLFTGKAPISVTQSIFGEDKRYPIFVPEHYFDEYQSLFEDYGDRVINENDLLGKTILHTIDNGIILLSGDTLYSSISNEYRYILSSVEISDEVVRIDDNAFYRCEHLKTVNIPNSVIYIGDYAFYGCSSLSKIIIGFGVETIGKSAFHNLTNSVVNLYTEAPIPPFLSNCEMFPSGIKIFVSKSYINKYKGVYIKPISDGTGAERQYLCLNMNSRHIYTVNRGDVTIKHKCTWLDDSYSCDGAITFCDGDYYLYDDLFLGQKQNNGIVSVLNIDYLTLTAVTHGGDYIRLNNCLIGVSSDGFDDLWHIYVPYTGNNAFVDSIEDDFKSYMFFGDDIRFVYGDDRMSYGKNLQPGTLIQKVCGDLEVDFGIGQNFEVNLLHEEQINNYVDEIKENSINNIIDYERHQFTPMYYTGKMSLDNKTADQYLQEHINEIDDNLKEVTEIRFRLNFREKVYELYDENGENIPIGDDSTPVDYVDFGSWETSDYGLWNNYVLDEDLKKLTYVYKDKKVYADLLGYLGYTDDDVYFQKDALKKSFLRLSFYDSPNRETQKLLYYSTIYFDTNSLSGKYIKDLNIWRETDGYTPKYNQLVFDGNIATIPNTRGEALTAEMSCTDKYDDTLSSDGFYIHLFDKLVSGNTCTPIYIKAEFNNAKFGKVVPMIYPTFKKDNKAIAATNESFPREYIKYGKQNGSGYTWIDMESLVRDSYIKVYIKYDFKTHNYVWFVPRTGDGSVLKFDLFEPRLNGYDPESYFAMTGNGRGYGTDDGKPKWFRGNFVKTSDGVYTWYRTREGDSRMYSEFGGGVTKKWPGNNNCTCLMTTAVTLTTDSMLKGTKIFNKNPLSKIKSIWIDGMMVYSDEFYNESTETYKTNIFQLPDIPFTTEYYDYNTQYEGYFEWSASTTQEVWDDKEGAWKYDSSVKPKTIHSVNYYFKTNEKNTYDLLEELDKGVYDAQKRVRTKKTIEATTTLVNYLKQCMSAREGETLPNSMFANLKSLKSVKTVKNGDKYFAIIGNGAFNNCQSLNQVNIEKDSVEIIGKNCFSGCRALKTVKLTNVKVILREAFQGCYTLNRTYYTVGPEAETRYIASGAFGYTKIREVAIPHTVLRMSNSAFRRCYQLTEFKLAERGNVEWLKFYGPNTKISNGVPVGTYDTDLYTFSGETLTSVLDSVGKRVFGDDAMLKYNLSLAPRSGSTKPVYNYYNSTPNLLNKLINKDVNVEFYNAAIDDLVVLQLTTSKDRGKMFYHFKDSEYREYLNEKEYNVYNFRDWFRYIF